MKRGKVNPRNRERQAAAFARSYGEESKALRLLPCIVASRGNGKHRCSPGSIEVAHVVARGMGGAKGGRFDIVPMCSKAHRNAGEFSTKPDSMRWAFENMFRVDLRAEADRLAFEHERPLGVRGLADRWAIWRNTSGGAATYFDVKPAFPPLDTYELDALRGWLIREMAREVERRGLLRSAVEAESRRLFGGVDEWRHGTERLRMVQRFHPRFDGLQDNDREALARQIAHLLGGDFTADPHGEHGLAWSLCEWATEGRWVS